MTKRIDIAPESLSSLSKTGKNVGFVSLISHIFLRRPAPSHNEDQRAEQLVDIVRVGEMRPMAASEARKPNATNFQVFNKEPT